MPVPARTANRGRPQQTGKAAKASKTDAAELHDEPEIDGEEPSLQGDDRRDAGDEALVKLKEYRQDRQEFKSTQEGDASHGGKGSAEAFIPGPNTPQARKPALDARTSAQDPPKRDVYGSMLKKATGEAAASSGSAPTAPLKTEGAQRLGPAAPPRSPAPSSVAASTPTRSSSRPDARTLLGTGKPVGTFLSEYAANHPEVPAALTGAVSEAQRLLAGVKGIERVAAGNYKGEPVVFILAQRGLSRETLRALPDKVQDFKAVISLPFDALPLKRPLGGSR